MWEILLRLHGKATAAARTEMASPTGARGFC